MKTTGPLLLLDSTSGASVQVQPRAQDWTKDPLCLWPPCFTEHRESGGFGQDNGVLICLLCIFYVPGVHQVKIWDSSWAWHFIFWYVLFSLCLKGSPRGVHEKFKKEKSFLIKIFVFSFPIYGWITVVFDRMLEKETKTPERRETFLQHTKPHRNISKLTSSTCSLNQCSLICQLLISLFYVIGWSAVELCRNFNKHYKKFPPSSPNIDANGNQHYSVH